MKADPVVQRRLLELAEVDAELNRVNHRRRTLPELEEIGKAERELQAKRDSLVSAQTSFGDIDRDTKRLEAEVEQVRAREDRDRKLMDSGSLSSSKQLEDLEHELATLTRRQGNLEDELLEVMEQREALESDVARAREEVTAAQARLEDAESRRDEEFADLDSAEAKRKAERQGLVTTMPEDLFALYDRIREHKGVGAGTFEGLRCGACRIEFDRSKLAELREAAADDVVRCEECGAILVRVKETGK